MGMMILALIVPAIFGLLSHRMASKRHRNHYCWFVAGLFFGPAALLILLMIGVRKEPTADC